MTNIEDDDDYIFMPKWRKVLLKTIPKDLVLRWNRFSFKHDAAIFAIEEKIDAIKDKLRPKIYYKAINWYEDNIRGVCVRTKNSLEWARMGWKDFDWDFHYFLRVMRFKLSRMEEEMRLKDRHVDSQVYAGQMRLAIECLDRLIDNNYNVMAYEELHKHYPERRINLLEGMKREVSLSPSGKKVVIYSSEHKEMPDEYYEMQTKLNYYYNDLLVADLRVLFHLMLPMTTLEKSKKDGNYYYGILNWWL